MLVDALLVDPPSLLNDISEGGYQLTPSRQLLPNLQVLFHNPTELALYLCKFAFCFILLLLLSPQLFLQLLVLTRQQVNFPDLLHQLCLLLPQQLLQLFRLIILLDNFSLQFFVSVAQARQFLLPLVDGQNRLLVEFFDLRVPFSTVGP